MTENTTATDKNWKRVGTLALAPVIAAGFLGLSSSADTVEHRAAETVPETTTTTVFEEPHVYPDLEADEYSYDVDESILGGLELDSDDDELLDEMPEAEDEPMGDYPEDPPAAAMLITDAETTVDSDGYGFYNVSNGGGEDLILIGIDVKGAPIELIAGEWQFGAYEAGIVEFQLDMDQVPFGEFEYTITQWSNAGSTDIEVKGFKYLVVILPSADLDFGTNWMLPHNAGHIELTIVNNEDHPVQITTESDDDRLFHPGAKLLQPGENTIHLWITHYFDVDPQALDIIEMEIAWDNTAETVTIQKYGS